MVNTTIKKVEKQPYYMKATATLLMKNTELNRIVDNDERFNEKVDVLKNFYAQARIEKQSLGKAFLAYYKGSRSSSPSRSRKCFRRTRRNCSRKNGAGGGII